MKLSDDAIDELKAAGRSLQRPGANTQLLASLGLVVTGHSRFGDYVQITADGQDLLRVPVAAPGPSKDGKLLRGTGPRKRRTPVSKAR